MQQYLEAGKVVTTHGVRGEMKLELWCDGVNFLKKVGRLYASAQGGRAWKIVSIRAQGQMALLPVRCGGRCSTLTVMMPPCPQAAGMWLT